MLRGAIVWSVLLASATVAASSQEPARATAVADDAPVFVEGKKCGCPNGCAMLKWMTSVMPGAVSSGEGAKIAKALEHVASKPVAGYGDWATIAKQGAEAAKKGNIDAAKQSCKTCHDKYQKRYQESEARCKGW